MLLNTCPAGKVLHESCFDLRNLSPADAAFLSAELRAIPDVGALDSSKDWFLVQPPVILSFLRGSDEMAQHGVHRSDDGNA